MRLQHPYLLFVGDARDQLAAKTAVGILQWRREWCVGQVRLEGCRAELDIPVMTIGQGVAAGARTLIVGVANAGDDIPDSLVLTLVSVLVPVHDVASVLHDQLSEN